MMVWKTFMATTAKSLYMLTEQICLCLILINISDIDWLLIFKNTLTTKLVNAAWLVNTRQDLSCDFVYNLYFSLSR